VSAIYGVVSRDDPHVGRACLSVMARALADFGRDGFGEWAEGGAGLGQARRFTTPEGRFEAMPVVDRLEGFAFTAAARLDNRDELIRELGVCVNDAARWSDSHLVFAAYRRFREAAPEHLLGDWCFAAWHPRDRRLFLARDHFGNTAIYYYADARFFAFAASQQALLALGCVAQELDELYLAQYLISWPAYHGERTSRRAIRRLPPAHTLTLTPEHCRTRLYWRMEDVSELRLPGRADYVEAFRAHFDQAVRVRLRANGEIGSQLSSGLDSGSVATTAASMLAQEGKRLRAFTWAPTVDASSFVGGDIGDEVPLARLTAAKAGNIDLHPDSCEQVTPIAGIRRTLDIYGDPVHAAGNLFWLIGLRQAAQRSGCQVLLIGQLGNAGTSWQGDVLSQPWRYQLKELGLNGFARRRVRDAVPDRIRPAIARTRLDAQWYRSSAIRPELASRLDLANRRSEDPVQIARSPLDQRFAILQPGRTIIGTVKAAMGAHFGLDLRDPTGDIRLLSFVLSVPDWVFIDPATGTDRWLVRAAMADRLPDEVRLNRRRGRQASDLVHRLRRTPIEVEATLDELDDGPAAAYVDVSYMREVWRNTQHNDTPDALRKARTVLLRGIMAGLHVNAVCAAGAAKAAL
jgi:asparagine synthase (glutamine-hydrolysing)